MRKKNPLELQPHPMNYRLYGKEPVDDELKRSIEKNGILVPLVILEDGTIISGHRRWKAALQVKPLPKLPCQVVGFSSDEEMQVRMIEYNIYRRKTDVQIMKEGELLEKIYAPAAEERKSENLKQIKAVKELENNIAEISKKPATEVPDVGTTRNDEKKEDKKPKHDVGLEFLDNLKTAEPEVSKPGKTREKVAKKLDVSKSKYGQIQRVRRARDSEDPEERKVYEKFEKEEITANKAETELKELKREKENPLEVDPMYKFIKAASNEPDHEISKEASNMLKLIDKGVLTLKSAYHSLNKIINERNEKSKKASDPERGNVLARGTVKKMIQTKLDLFQTKVSQVSPDAVKFLQEYFEDESHRITIKAAKNAEKENRKTIDESDIRRALNIPVR